jgi:hypothetical protein
MVSRPAAWPASYMHRYAVLLRSNSACDACKLQRVLDGHRRSALPVPAPPPAGPLPPSLSKSSLSFLALGGNALSGTIPPLPPTMVMLNVSDNQLTGELPSLPSALLAFEVAANKLSGGLPAGVGAAKVGPHCCCATRQAQAEQPSSM